MKTILAFLISLFFCTLGIAQNDSIILYTKPGCNNCKATKQALQRAQISYKEVTLENAKNGEQMISRLKTNKYTGTIHLPVIFINNTLIYPKDSTTDIEKTVNGIITKHKSKEYNFVSMPIPAQKTTSITDTIVADCNYEDKKETKHVIILEEVNNEQEALQKNKEYVNKGYIYTGILYNGKTYKLYNQTYNSLAEANTAYEQIRIQFPNSYILNFETKEKILK